MIKSPPVKPVEAKRYKVSIPVQSRTYTNQEDARKFAIALLSAGVFYLEIKDEVNE